MNSLDDVRDSMQTFIHAFRAFNQDLESSLAMLRERHDAISGLWTDEAARRYQQEFGPFEETLRRYSTHEGPRLQQYIEEKLRLLERYLHGD